MVSILPQAPPARIVRHVLAGEAVDDEDSESIFFFAIEVTDLFCLFSVMQHDEVTPAFSEEAVRATIAYLRTYIPPVLAPVTRP